MATIREHWYLLRTALDSAQPQTITAHGDVTLTIGGSAKYGNVNPWNAFRIDIVGERQIATDSEQERILSEMYDPSFGGLVSGKISGAERESVAELLHDDAIYRTVIAFCDCLAWTIGTTIRVHPGEATIAYGDTQSARLWWIHAPLRLRPNGMQTDNIVEMTGAYPVDRKTKAQELAAALQQLPKGLPGPVELFLEVEAIKWEMRSAAVVMLCACAEWAVKERVSVSRPDTAWLLRELSSPPIHKMIKQYLPSLGLLDATVAGEHHKNIERAFNARNSIVHDCAQSFDKWQNAVKQVLLALYQ